MGGQTLEAVETDRKYNALAIRYNALLGWIDCVIEAVNEGKKPTCEANH